MSGVVANAQKESAKEGQRKAIRCPVDSEEFDTLEQLSQHVDQVHIGPGVFEGLHRESWSTKKKESSH